MPMPMHMHISMHMSMQMSTHMSIDLSMHLSILMTINRSTSMAPLGLDTVYAKQHFVEDRQRHRSVQRLEQHLF